MGILCALTLGLSCGEEMTGGGDPPLDNSVADLALKDTEPPDTFSPDAPPGAMELVSGGITTLGGWVATDTKLEGTPDFEISEDGLVTTGVHGEQCTTDKTLCITEGGFIP